MRFPGFVNGSYQMRSITTDCQRCINMYPDPDEMTVAGVGAKAPPTAKEGEIGALMATPGLKLYLNLPTGPCRGTWTAKKQQRSFAVGGNKFYEIIPGSPNTYLELGTLLTSSGPVGMNDNGIELVIVDGPNGYAYAFDEKSILPSAYDFTTAPANATAGATYQNNAQTFTVLDTIAPGTLLQTTGTGDPLSSGTLTLFSGTGDPTITFASFTVTSQQPWLPLHAYNVGDTIIPTPQGYVYECIQAGTSDAFPPNFPTSRYATVSDGSVLWKRTSSFHQITDPGFLGSNIVAYMDGYFIFIKPGTNTVYSSDNFATTFNALNFINLEGSTAPGLNIVAMHRNLYIATSATVEVYYDAGLSPGFPFARINGAYMDQGIAAQFSLSQTANAMFWIGRDSTGKGIVYMTSDYMPKRISTFAVEEQLASYSDISDAIAYTYTEGGHVFYVINFPTAQKTWSYDISTNFWHERAYNSNGNLVMQLGVYHTFGFDKHLIGSYVDGKIYEMSQDFLNDDGTVIIRRRVAPHLAQDMLRVFYSSLQIDIQQGYGLDGDIVPGSDPQCMLRFSDDGGRTWSNIKQASIGKIGQYKKRVIFRRLGYSRDRVFELTISDPVFMAIMGAELYLEAGNS